MVRLKKEMICLLRGKKSDNPSHPIPRTDAHKFSITIFTGTVTNTRILATAALSWVVRLLDSPLFVGDKPSWEASFRSWCEGWSIGLSMKVTLPMMNRKTARKMIPPSFALGQSAKELLGGH